MAAIRGEERSPGRVRGLQLALGSLVVMAAIGSGWIASDLWASMAGDAPAVTPEPPPRPRPRPSSRPDRSVVPASFQVECAEEGRSPRSVWTPASADPPAPPAPRPTKLLCCDGTRSPTCGCDRDSNRGCCSHHGGVCGGCDD
jgi:hypothetical protein